MHSCIYEGQLRHTRRQPALHRFRYRVFMMYLDLDELPTVFAGRWFWSVRRPALARFRRGDHIGHPSEPLADSIRNLVERETGERPDGPIRLLTNLSYFGYCFNPVSFYYCHSGGALHTIVVEVNNTPWGERDAYVLPPSMNRNAASDAAGDTTLRYQPQKKMHVSPFMSMQVDYDWRFTVPGERLSVHMANAEQDNSAQGKTAPNKMFFDAALNLQRKEISAFSLAGVLLRFPLMTLQVIVGIHWQALRLWLKRCPVHIHPAKRRDAS